MNLKVYLKLQGLTLYCLTRALCEMLRIDLRYLTAKYPETQARILLDMLGQNPFPEDECEAETTDPISGITGRPVFFLDDTYVDLNKKH